MQVSRVARLPRRRRSCRACATAWCCARWAARKKRSLRGETPMAPVPVEVYPVNMTPGHQPVLLREVLELLAPRTGGRYLDCTFGGGGHTRAPLAAPPAAHVRALPRHPPAPQAARRRREEFRGRVARLECVFARLAGLPMDGFDGILFDFGVSSFQLDDTARGFSFRTDAPADMRMDPRTGVPASRWLETATEEMLVRAIRDFGEEGNWRRVVRALLAVRGPGQL